MLSSYAAAWKRAVAVALVGVMLVAGLPTIGAEAQEAGRDQEIEALRSELERLRAQDEQRRREIEMLRQRDEEYRKRIDELGAALETIIDDRSADVPAADSSAAAEPAPAVSPEDALSEALSEIETADPAPPASSGGQGVLWGRRMGNAELQLINISADILFAAGGSTASDDELEVLQGGGHDPKRNGFTLQGAELGLSGAVDPYFRGDIFINAFLEGLELEEAFITTLSLPYQLQLEAGLFFTEFGVINPRHPHAWEFMDQPVVNTRFFGPEGMRSEGFRLSWLTPLEWPSELMFGAQNANRDSFTTSFIGGNPIGNRPNVGREVNDFIDLAYLARWVNSWQNGPEWTSVLGVSGMYGPNDTGKDGQTWIYGFDYRLKWVPTRNFRGYPFFSWQTEFIKRDYTADWFIAGTEMSSGGGDGGGVCHGGHCHGGGGETGDDDQTYGTDLDSDILRDWGGYTQAVWGFRPNWSTGLRLEYADASGDSIGIDGEFVGTDFDVSRDERWRTSLLLAYRPTHFSRLRLQYNYDHNEALSSSDAHTVWFGLESVFGAHPAHDY